MSDLIWVQIVCKSYQQMTLGPGQLAQSVTHMTADPGVWSSIPAQSHIFVKINHEISVYMYCHSPPSADSRSNRQKYVHEVLVNCLVELAKEKVWLCELNVST